MNEYRFVFVKKNPMLEPNFTYGPQKIWLVVNEE
jgi:hypothetical protein